MPRFCTAFLIALATLLPSCGSGGLKDIWKTFPASAFEQDPEPIDPNDPNRPPQPFEPVEVGFIASSGGATGDIRNIAVAILGAQALAFVSAQDSGVHIIDVTLPSTVSSSSLLGTIDNTSLTAPAEIAGGRVDTLTVIDGIYLVCVAVGAQDITGNSVTVFHIPTLQTILAGPGPHDFSIALFPGTAPIGVTGNADGKAGGVSGAAGTFVVAGGGDTLFTAIITPGTPGPPPIPGSWTPGPPFLSPIAPPIENWLDILVSGTTGFASVVSNGSFGIVALTLLPTPAVNTDPIIIVPGNFSALQNNSIAGPGNFALDMTVDVTTSTLYVGGDGQVESFNITSPINPITGAQVPATGNNTIAVHALGGTLAVGADNAVRVFQAVPPLPLQLVAEVDFPGQIRGVFLRSTMNGRFVLCCGGTRGFRVVQWSDLPG